MKRNIFFNLLLPLYAVNYVSYINSEPILVTIDKFVGWLDKNSSCAVSSWNNNLNNSCLCCIVKNAEELKKGKTAQEIIKECLDEGHCNTMVINQFIKKNVGERYSLNNFDASAEETLKKLIIALEEQSILLKEVEPANIHFDANGNFMENSVAPFLAKAYKDGKLDDPSFKSVDCCSVKNIASEEAGRATLQLFIVTSTCSGTKKEYILKEVKEKEEEVINLAKANLIDKLQPFIYPNHSNANFPYIVLPEAYLSYKYKNKNHMLSLMPKAKGVALSKFMKDYKKDPSEKNLQQAAFAYENVGEKLSSFHKQFMRAGQFLGTTALHGDFHHGNVFVDDNGDVYFIDNERMANSFANPHDISNDVDYLFYITLGTLVTPPEFYNGFNTNLWIETILKSFIIGYLKPYEENERLPVLNGLEDRFKNSGKYLNIKLYGNFGQYAKYKTPIDEAFNELYKIYGGDAA